MGRWRGKVLFALIVYTAGFFTAVYVLAPADMQTAGGREGIPGCTQDGTAGTGFDSQAWSASVRAGMDKAVAFAEEQALLLVEKIKTGMQQSTPDTRE